MNKDKRARLYQARRILGATDLERASSIVRKVAEEEREAFDNLAHTRGFGCGDGGLQRTNLAAGIHH